MMMMMKMNMTILNHIFISSIFKPPNDFACISYLFLKTCLNFASDACQISKKTIVQRNTPLKTSFSKRWPGTVLLVAIGDETLEGIPGHLSFGRVKLIGVYLVQLLGFAEDFPHLRLAARVFPLHSMHRGFFCLVQPPSRLRVHSRCRGAFGGV